MLKARAILLAFAAFAFAWAPLNAAANSTPTLLVQIVLDDGAALFEELTSQKSDELRATLNDFLAGWIRERTQDWKITTSGGSANRVTLEIGDQADEEHGKVTPSFNLELRFLGALTHEIYLPSQRARPVINDIDRLSRMLEVDLKRFAVENWGQLQRKLSQMFFDLEGDLGTKSELRYALAPASGPVAYSNLKIRRVWQDGDYDNASREQASPYFKDQAYFGQPGQRRSGSLYRLISGSYEQSSLSYEFCVVRVGASEPQVPVAEFSCTGLGNCELEKSRSTPAGWFDNCNGSWLKPLEIFTIGRAQADTHRPKVWNVPSLETMARQWRAGILPDQGFTMFEISADKIRLAEVDGYRIALKSNKTPVWIDGVPPEKLVYPFDPKIAFIHRFPMETLNFYGRTHGCDVITAEITFMKGNEPATEPVVLRRPYAALRGALDFPDTDGVKTEVGTFHWTGRYIHPKKGDEYQLFLDSGDFEWEEDFTSNESRKKLVTWLHKVQAAFEGLAWTAPQGILQWDGATRPAALVGYLRPPLQEVIGRPGYYGYGVAIAAKRPSGQIQMTFPKDVARSLAQHLVTLANRHLDDAGMKDELTRFQGWLLRKKILVMETNPYIRRSRRAEPVPLLDWVCNTTSDIVETH